MSEPDNLLRNFIHEALFTEDGEGGYDGGGYGSAGVDQVTGARFGSESDMYRIFIKPFTDVAKVAAGNFKELGVKTQTLVKVTYEAIGSTLFPFWVQEYGKIFEEDAKKVAEARKEYANVMKDTWNAFTDDAFVIAFMINPGGVVAGTIAKSGAITDGTAKIISALSGGASDKFIHKARNILIRSKEGDERAKRMRDEMLATISQSLIGHRTYSMRQAGARIMGETIASALRRNRGLEKIKTIDDLKRFLHGTPAEQKLSQLATLEGASDAEKQQMVQAIVRDMSSASKRASKQAIDSYVQKLIAAGVPPKMINDIAHKNEI